MHSPLGPLAYCACKEWLDTVCTINGSEAYLQIGAYQEHVRLATKARQAWLAAPPDSLLTLGCRHSCCLDPSTAVLGLQHSHIV